MAGHLTRDAKLSARVGTGRHAEDLAAALLEGMGYEVLARNWRRKSGEIDLVVTRDAVCVFVEVRSRTGLQQGHPLETVGGRKRQRIIRAARLYLDEERPRFRYFRFDCIGVVFFEDGRSPEMVHVPDAFRLG